jgi:hypothetical protein
MKGELIAVFHAPQPFFDCLQERISLGSKKKRLPNTTTTFIRKVNNYTIYVIRNYIAQTYFTGLNFF